MVSQELGGAIMVVQVVEGSLAFFLSLIDPGALKEISVCVMCP